MQVTYRCPYCEATGETAFEVSSTTIACQHCQGERPIPGGAVTAERLQRCLICPSTEVYIRKDFSQALGVAIVALGAVVSSIFWLYRMPLWTYATLFATAAIDIVLYVTVGNVLQCYRCHAQYRGTPGLDNHEPFNLETHERHRQQEIRLAEARSGGREAVSHTHGRDAT